MSRPQLSEQELRLEAERFVKYRGTVRVRLEVLHSQWNEPRGLSRKNVERLKEIFQGEKMSYGNIRRLDPRTHILLWLSDPTLVMLSSLPRYRWRDC
ncbi:hypothetical protein DL95DRAFT_487092 [Leptodontidium sp. 2 PMI_412]|nr:hypothetical protein DL95DRAFT_487092 [Leptodontidium sp. 2 PMI_412]